MTCRPFYVTHYAGHAVYAVWRDSWPHGQRLVMIGSYAACVVEARLLNDESERMHDAMSEAKP